MDQKSETPKPRDIGIYSKILITRNISLHIVSIGNNVKEILMKKLSSEIEGKCIVEGYIKPKSVSILTYSSGVIKGNKILFEIVFECQVCSPVEGMHIRCLAKNITKAGIRAEIDDGVNSTPLVIFVARDHHLITPYFNSVVENNSIIVRVIGRRFELNDTYICVIAELIDPSTLKANK
jgi:DNA-directed RNA polymerase subunit E'/Rpb7